ncbi:beta-amylase 8 isoform X2 [Morus notabilis]|uniref:beta-amylase 8 isoform X2 n=1 Tax=Morus notabilis TaxID=981085 RepID=UPI000CECFC54|nr:beta-amylase 8 isoform X2 [Morus notabilis]
MNEKENKMMNEEDQSDPPEVFPHSIQTPTQPQGRRPRGFAATHQLGPNTTTTGGHSPSDNPSKGGKREREREKEKERTKLRERHRRAITSRMLAGLRQYGNFPLPARADMNDVLAALARQAGWLVDPDGTTYRPQHHGHHGDASYNNNNCQQSSSRDSLVDVDVDSLLPIHDNTNTNTLSMSMSPTSLDSVVIAPPPDTADTTASIHSPQTQNQLMQQEDFPSVATPYVPVYVKISSVIINNFCQLVDPESVQQELTDLQSLNVDGVVVQCWWGIVESWTPQKYIWSGYRHLFNIVRHFKLKLQVVMAFHEYAASESGETLITLPQWVLEIGKENPDIFFTDREGRRNTECLSWGIDKERVLQGRTGIEVYFDLMRSFRTEFDDLFAEGIICAVEIGLGPSGELKYPSFSERMGWKYPGIGEFQCYDKYLEQSLRKAAKLRGHSFWARGPDNAGEYNSRPHETGFFCERGDYDSYYGRFFLHWYAQSLIDHADNVLSLANLAFEETEMVVKVNAVYWWYKTPSHAAELTSGYYNPTNQDGYSPVFEVLKKHGVTVKFVCSGLQMSTQDSNEFLADPEGLSWQWK